MEQSYSSLETLIGQHINQPMQSRLLNMIDDNREVMQRARGSTNNHQAWEGGWWDHYTEGFNIAVQLYSTLHSLRPLPFSLHDVLVSFFAHDIEKPWKYDFIDGEWHHKSNFQTKMDANDFRTNKLVEYDIELTPEQANAMLFAEGEIDNMYSSRHRSANELAGIVHAVDFLSARLWHDCPRKENDPWSGAQRVQSDIK